MAATFRSNHATPVWSNGQAIAAVPGFAPAAASSNDVLLYPQASVAGRGLVLMRAGLLLVHGGIIAYVAAGWLIPSRVALLVYSIVLPVMAMQWLLNGGSSVMTNLEILARTGRWSEPGRGLEGTLFRRTLGAIGIRATTAQIDVVVLSAMVFFWMAAMYHMILIAPTALTAQ